MDHFKDQDKAPTTPSAFPEDPPTIIVEVRGGLVQNVFTEGQLDRPLKVVVRDHDTLAVDPEDQDQEWLLGGG